MDRDWRADAARAGGLALALGAAWTVRDWSALSALRLPDTDDAMRLVQVRDWLGGQGWSDLTQHRLAGGLPMHWTRAADLGPAGLIVALAPVVGRHGAEVAAVVAWPLMLFAAALFLIQRTARIVAGAPAAGVAAVIAAIAYPATTVFAPGRIDHHGLQLVLLLGSVLMLLGPTTLGRGAGQGVLGAASLVVGLETAPLIGVLGLVAVVEWVRGNKTAQRRLGGLAVGAGGGLVAARAAFAADGWTIGWCDGLTLEAWRATAAMAGALALLALIPARVGPGARTGLVVAVLAGAGAFVASVAPRCLSPYGGVDPYLVRVWLARVGEARSILTAPPGTSFAYLGLAAAGLIAGGWRLRRKPTRGWAVLAALQAVALAVACVQLRGAYPAALLAAPALAAVVVAARGRGSWRLAGAWAASAGMLYPLAAGAVPAASDPPPDAVTCELPPALARLAPGRVLAPIDLGPRILLETRHSVVAAPYHRNNAGNRALFMARNDPAAARVVFGEWRIAYVVACDPAWARAAGLRRLDRDLYAPG
ncbi:hypothetical protein [uncultured Sphingomonas sp.]|uniref:hypothetical protein n=1 Tax=uncultured Sphingomonas sp. TaxID=158754 RepID=UPI0035CB4264